MYRNKLCIGNYFVLSVTNAFAAFGCLNFSLVCNLNVKTFHSHVALAATLSHTRLDPTYSTLCHSFFPHFHTLFALPVSSEHIYTLYPYLHIPTRPFFPLTQPLPHNYCLFSLHPLMPTSPLPSLFIHFFLPGVRRTQTSTFTHHSTHPHIILHTCTHCPVAHTLSPHSVGTPQASS